MNSLPLISFIVNRKKYKEFIKYSISMQNQLYYTRFGTRKDKRTMDRTLSYTIEAADDGENVGEYLRHHGYSQPLLIHLKKTQEGILLNGIWC